MCRFGETTKGRFKPVRRLFSCLEGKVALADPPADQIVPPKFFVLSTRSAPMSITLRREGRGSDVAGRMGIEGHWFCGLKQPVKKHTTMPKETTKWRVAGPLCFDLGRCLLPVKAGPPGPLSGQMRLNAYPPGGLKRCRLGRLQEGCLGKRNGKPNHPPTHPSQGTACIDFRSDFVDALSWCAT